MNAIVKIENHDKQEIKFTTCYMCACRCGIKVTLEEDKVRFIQGNRNHPTNQGVLCAKGSAGIMKQYSAAKLRKPLLRKPGSERGDGEFVEIEWDEALDMLTERLGNIRATDPSKLAFFTGRVIFHLVTLRILKTRELLFFSDTLKPSPAAKWPRCFCRKTFNHCACNFNAHCFECHG